MPFIEVQSIPPTGFPELDRAHSAVVDSVNALYIEWQIHSGRLALCAAAESVSRAAASLFRQEDELLKALPPAGRIRHLEHHEAFLTCLARLVDDLRQSHHQSADLMLDLFMDIEQFVFDHLMIEDQDYFEASSLSTPSSHPGGL